MTLEELQQVITIFVTEVISGFYNPSKVRGIALATLMLFIMGLMTTLSFYYLEFFHALLVIAIWVFF